MKYVLVALSLVASIAHAQDDDTTPPPVEHRAPVLVPAPEPVVRAPAGGMPQYAFVAEFRLGANGIVAGSSTLGIVEPSLTLGARLFGRLHVGLGFGLVRVSFAEGSPLVSNGNSTTTTIFDVEPTASFDVVQSRDRRVALYLKLGLPVGAIFQTDVDTKPVVGYDVALGVRYAPHHMFGVGFEGGVSGLFVDPTGDFGYGVTMIYGALVGTFFSGK